MYAHRHLRKNNKNITIIKWFCIFFIILTTLIYNYYFKNVILLFRILCNLCFIGSICFIFLYTELGKKLFLLFTESKNEIKTILWPNKTETLYTTFIIFIVTVIMSLLIWGLDNILFHLVSFITNLRL